MRIHAIKGASEGGKPIRGTASSQEVNWRGQKWAHGIKLWIIGVDTAKDLLHGQLAIQTPGPGFVHFASDLQREWFEQLTAEQRILARHNGGDSYRWVKRRPRNEVLDTRNYAMHAAHMLGLHAMNEHRWLQIEQVVQPAADLFRPALPPDATVPNSTSSVDRPAPAAPHLPPASAAQRPPPQRLAIAPPPAGARREW